MLLVMCQELTADEIEEILLDDAPDDYVCPVSLILMTDPVVAMDGISYQRDALLQHIAYAKQSE